MLNRIINENALIRNYLRCKQDYQGKTIFPVLKNNAYGLGILRVANLLSKATDATMFCVSTVQEAKKIVHFGKKILVFDTPQHYFDHSLIIYSINSFEEIKKVSKLKNRNVHIQFDLGQHRSQLRSLSDVESAYDQCLKSKIKVEGLYTHFRLENIEKEAGFATKVFKVFEGRVTYLHAQSSETSQINLGNAARIGSNLYGDGCVSCYEQTFELYTKATQIIKANKGDTFGYFPGLIIDKSCFVAELPIGYSDGFLKSFAGSFLFVRGRKVLVSNAISMNKTYVVSEQPLRINDKFVITSTDFKVKEFCQPSKMYNTSVLMIFRPTRTKIIKYEQN